MPRPVHFLFCFLCLSLPVRAALALPGAGTDTNTVGALTVSSVPPEADVFIDGKMVGRTPVQLPRVPAGIRMLRVAKSGFCDFSDSVIVMEGLSVDRAVRLDSACGLIVRSDPDSAAVYVENVLVGRSPLRISNQKAGWKTVKVMKVNSAPWEDYVYVAAGATVTVNAKLKSKFGSLSMYVFSDDVDVLVDGKTAGRGSLTDYMIPGGMHEIGARSADGSRTVSETVYILPGESVHWQARLGERSMKPFFTSMALPGLGQVLNGSPAKGFIIMGGFAAAGVFTLVAHILYEGDVSQYNDALGPYRNASNEPAALSEGAHVSSLYDKLHSAYRLRTDGWIGAGAIYLYSLVDALLNHSTVNTLSQTAMESTGRTGPDLAVSESGGRVTFRITF